MRVLAITLAAAGCSHAAGGAKPLFCAYGGVGVVPVPTPADFDTELAVAVVEIDSPRAVSGLSVTDFTLRDEAGTPSQLRRVVEVERFERPRIASEGEFAWYLNPGDTRPWDGTLPAGKTRLRVRVSFDRIPAAPVRCSLTLGPYVIEAPVDGAWPT